jgi:hypothetical protein
MEAINRLNHEKNARGEKQEEIKYQAARFD